jgi:AcrR family transcriptional regulator
MTAIMDTMRKTRRGRGVPDKRDAILQAAARLFAADGFERTTTKAIARKAGVAEGTLYLFFPTKKHILLAFLEPVDVQALADYFEQAQGKPEEVVIRGFLLNRYRLWQTHGDLLKVLFGTALFDRELAEEFCKRVIHPATELIEAYLAHGIRAGAFRNLDPRLAARALVGYVFAPALLNDYMPEEKGERVTPEQYASEFTELFLNGMRASVPS